MCVRKVIIMTEFLPLGSIVLLKGGIQKILIISRALKVRNGNEEYFFDYGGVTYPEGLVGDQMAYFNADKIYLLKQLFKYYLNGYCSCFTFFQIYILFQISL